LRSESTSPKLGRLSREQFLQNLSDSGLLSKEEIAKSVEALPAPTALLDGDALAHGLAAAGKLTGYQADAVRSRQFDSLRIGNYEVLDRLGQGGMGTVYKARHRRMHRVVAIKVLSRTVEQAGNFLQRFQREIETVARLTHPHIVMAFDADEAEVGHYLVMEFVDGRDLDTEVRTRGPLPVGEALGYVVQAAGALAYAHRQGIIHRDIKPANLLRDAGGVVKVADLGLARFTNSFGGSGEVGGGLTQAGGIVGTVDYMPPEQALDSTRIDERADVYSLGCSLYYLVTGRPPFQGETIMATLLMHRDAPIPSLCEARPGVPPTLDALFRRMVAKRPEDRYQSMAEVVTALTPLAETLGRTVAPPATHPVAPADTPAAGTTGVWESQPVPAAPPAAAAQTINQGPPDTAGGFPQRVLLVEPSRTQAAIIRKYLQDRGVRDVVVVASGQEALRAVGSERPDAVVSTMHLADMTGVELAQQLRRENQAAAPGFVLMASQAERSEAGTLSKCGKAVLLHKPFTAPQLTEALKLVSAGQAASLFTAECGKLRVLIVDDSAPARRHIQDVLAGLGVKQFVEATDGARAVAAVAGAAFDLIVTDYNMPYMDGRGLVAFLKQDPSTAAIPIIMVTTEEDPAKLQEVRQLGVAAVCEKSFPPEVVRGILGRLVDVP
jgi:CheY-like chemotaxis protein